MAHNAYLATFAPKDMISRGSPAYRIAPSLIAKSRNPLEWDNTAYARSHLNIPIPQPRYPHLKYWFVADFIKGKSLIECWDSLGLYMRFRIACTLRGYISQMRSLTRNAPGSPIGGHVHGYIFSRGYYSGPFESAATFHRYIEDVTFRGWQCRFDSDYLLRGLPLPEKPILLRDYDSALVFTHADISPSNLMLSDDGVLWMIDWATCGFYPSWVEALAMYRYDKFRPRSWNYFIWLVAGSPPKQRLYWDYFLEEANSYSFLEPSKDIIP